MANNIILDADLDPQSKKPSVQNYASTGQRFINYLIDMIAFYLIVFLIGMVMGTNSSLTSMMDSPLFGLSLYGVFFLYYLVMEVSMGKTIGKLVTRTMVVNEHGEKPDTGTILLRTLIRFIPFEPFSAFASNARMWHDSWTKTYVIKSN